MANKVDVFTEELSKVFTILQQQYVMIKYMKALITSGELDETEINKLKEQVTLINNQIQHINEKMVIIQNDITDINTNIDTIMNDQIMPIKQNIERIEQGMNTLNNEKLDKVENRGVTPKVYVTTEGQQTTLDVSLKYSNYNIPRYSSSGTLSVNTPTNGDNAANKDYVDNAISSVSGGKLYRHDLKISHNRTAYDDNKHDIFLTYYSSNNLVADTPEKLTTLTQAINGTNLRATVYSITSTGSSDYDKISLYYIGAVYDGSAWNLMNSNGTSTSIVINSVTDTVTPI